MLTALNIQNFILIDQMSLEVSAGMTALTGETGAGKSILLDALGLAVGARLERGVIRDGAEQGVVSAAFEPRSDHPVWSALAANGLEAPDDQVILRRVQTRDGRSRAFVNDQPVSVSLLRAIGETLVEIHGQHDGRGFLTASTHRELLDEFGGHLKLRDETVVAHGIWREAEAALEEKKAGRAKAAAEADYLAHVVRELGELRPEADEDEKLAARRLELQAAEKVTEELAAAMGLLGEDGLEGKLSAASRRLARASAKFPADGNPLAPVIDRLETALGEAMEARAALEDAAERLGADPNALEKTEERLFALRAAARKHGVSVAALPGFLARAAAALAELETGEAGFHALEAASKAAEGAYRDRAAALSKARAKAAAALDEAVARELRPLRLGKAEFLTELRADEHRPMAEGYDAVEFMVRTNPGAPPGPMKAIASGGELSRFVLAMKAALAAKENRTVIIFDEIDSGVGGAVADAVGERLLRLARDAQVLVVTHSPQVAARAVNHWRIEKTQTAKRAATRVSALSQGERVEEIARMLSGAEVTAEARAAAAKLLGAPAPALDAKRRRRA
jgi:DNA repair protein RecN (Recombination protein N)